MSKYYDIKYDKDVTRSQYVPYLNDINEEYITLFNKNILMNRFGYYKDEKNPNNFITSQNRYINDDDRTKYYKKELDEVILLYDRIGKEFMYAINSYKSKLNEYENNLKLQVNKIKSSRKLDLTYNEMNDTQTSIRNLKNTIDLYIGYKQKIDSHLSYQINYLEEIIDKINNINNEGSIANIFRIKFPNIKFLLIILFLSILSISLIKIL
tara:strand:- start:2725 stop:3354 length:630 start_codon:yes stop_codon:yes gene_type:complete